MRQRCEQYRLVGSVVSKALRHRGQESSRTGLAGFGLGMIGQPQNFLACEGCFPPLGAQGQNRSPQRRQGTSVPGRAQDRQRPALVIFPHPSHARFLLGQVRAFSFLEAVGGRGRIVPRSTLGRIVRFKLFVIDV